MRQGFNPKIFFTPKGEIFAIATGSDACTEHECGSQPMQEALCTGSEYFVPDTVVIDALRKNGKAEFPDMVTRKTLRKNLERLRFLEGAGSHGRQMAAIVFQQRLYADDAPLARYRELDPVCDHQISGAWDEDSFGFLTAEPKLNAKLKVFFEALQKRDGIFAGTFLKSEEFEGATGVMIALQSKLRPEHRIAIKAAQTDYEQSLRLKALSRVAELHDLKRAADAPAHVRHPGHLWPVWENGPGSTVMYAVNPDYMSKKWVGYGPYSFEDLKAWMLAETPYNLVSSRKPKAIAVP